MSNYAKNLAEHRRIAILKLLVEAQGATNESILQSSLGDLGLGAMLTRNAVREDMKFLEDRGLIRQEWYDDKLVIAHIQRRGVDVAEGKELVEGIKRPSLGE